jgi:hypothetical protein
MNIHLALIIALCLAAPGLHAQPKISVRDSAFEFGTVAPGSKVAKSTIVTNIGSTDLVIEDITASCGCSNPSIEKSIIPAGSSTRLTVIFDGKNFFGAIDKGILIVSNDTSRRNYRIPVRAFVAQLLLPDPIVIVFDDTGDGSAVRRISLRNVSQSNIRLGPVSSSIPGVVPKLTKTRLAPGATTILVVTLSGKGARKASGEVVIQTNRREQKKVKLSCFVRRPG